VAAINIDAAKKQFDVLGVHIKPDGEVVRRLGFSGCR